MHTKNIINHYINNWKTNPQFYLWDKGPIDKLPSDFRVLEFAPTGSRNMWTYATSGMCQRGDDHPIEIHLFSSIQDIGIVELLTVLVYYHRNTAQINLNHTVNFGKSWQNSSSCEYGYISLPYLDGPDLENLYLSSTDTTIKFYWLIPITKEEKDFSIQNGSDSLEEKFDDGFDYLNPIRKSVLG